VRCKVVRYGLGAAVEMVGAAEVQQEGENGLGKETPVLIR
jgi:hypothetical protein